MTNRELSLMTPHQAALVRLARRYQRDGEPLPLDLTTSLLAEGLSPDPFTQIDIEDYING